MKTLKYHMNLSKNTKNINFILLIILVIFVILSFMIRNLPGGDTHWTSITTEFGFIENTQLILLIYAIYLNIIKAVALYLSSTCVIFPWISSSCIT